MIRNEAAQELLEKARHAEQRAREATDQAVKADWHRVAREYYDLAEGTIMVANIIAAFEEPLSSQMTSPAEAVEALFCHQR